MASTPTPEQVDALKRELEATRAAFERMRAIAQGAIKVTRELTKLMREQT